MFVNESLLYSAYMAPPRWALLLVKLQLYIVPLLKKVTAPPCGAWLLSKLEFSIVAIDDEKWIAPPFGLLSVPVILLLVKLLLFTCPSLLKRIAPPILDAELLMKLQLSTVPFLLIWIAPPWVEYPSETLLLMKFELFTIPS